MTDSDLDTVNQQYTSHMVMINHASQSSLPKPSRPQLEIQLTKKRNMNENRRNRNTSKEISKKKERKINSRLLEDQRNLFAIKGLETEKKRIDELAREA